MHFHSHTVQTRITTPLGPVRLAASPAGLAGLWFEGQRHEPLPLLHGASAWSHAPDHPLLQAASGQLQQYLRGARAGFELPLDLSGGTAFQQSVWRALLTIARGQTISYGALSQQLGRPRAVRAVGAAVGRNPLSVVVPCHRVLGTDGSLTGYAGGLERKTALLTLDDAPHPHPGPHQGNA
ncbi:methylated-DNA--[protein]-cysteine S-methyltransferase [Verminephrobacter eiseniae]|uniref:Methylated-DNA--protein-cysteine methyltransferase n=1 Tax=Verminephrobacter eiseniae (strain EF01-2) TaxID=391735 RepID=A1WKZ9_VEREI|nr:methylated-DNA--[protein]-cysteine S-methyltransferase [Verminephrobacter eiseniae]KAB7634880.1 methylated-DNA--[protein]-cysteine S-methyltransferase [Verminephrobacter sp. Larva24]ABM58306.1 methylated-DNA--protein-cysteine methyltransferase [Verminephrobacter eiseniae EF01-2]MCW5232404.1 methylated-DNA--[protein]-cysteine S-methyltransferase [Verminephrobacter eiseniae]MCW5263119.1 methylated-DNA--[protein]-cysteine S-methyltransferase [Verminephrobacter eiseniae]MCW5283890.1 methylated-